MLIVSNEHSRCGLQSLGAPVPVLRDHERAFIAAPIPIVAQALPCKCWPLWHTGQGEKHDGHDTKPKLFYAFLGTAFCISQNVSPCSFKFHEDWVADQWLSLNQDLFPIHPVGHCAFARWNRTHHLPQHKFRCERLEVVETPATSWTRLLQNQGAQCVALCTLAKLPHQAEPNDKTLEAPPVFQQ